MIATGSIRKRKTKVGYDWQITVELPKDPLTGKRVRKYKTVRGSKKDAERVMREYITELEKGFYVTDNKITVSQWMQTWLTVYSAPNASPTTFAEYEGMVARYVDPMIGHIQVQQLTMLAVQAWVNKLRTSPITGLPMAAASVRHIYQIVKSAMDKAVLAGVISRSPCIGVILPKGKPKEAVIYNEQETQQLLQAVKGTTLELVIDMELCLGLRRGELLGLRWCDIDWENSQIHIVQNRVLARNKVIVRQPKTEAGFRTIDTPLQLMEKLKQHKADCEKRRKEYGNQYIVSDYVIVHPNGKPIPPGYLSRMFTDLQEKAGLPSCRFHDLRHLCASIMNMQDINIKVAQKRLGHSNITTTMNIYTHPMRSKEAEAAQTIGDFIYNILYAGIVSENQ